MKFLILMLVFMTFVKAEKYPLVYSKLSTPLFKADTIFSKYIEYSNVEEQSRIYSSEVKKIMNKGFLLDKKFTTDELSRYLQSLRKLEKKYTYLVFTLSRELLNAISKNDYDAFYKLSSIPIESFYQSSQFKQKVLLFYKNNKNNKKITVLENIIRDATLQNNELNQQLLSKKTSYIEKKLDSIYWTSSINANNTSTKYNGYIYGGTKEAISSAIKVLDLGVMLGGVCSDKDGNIYWVNRLEAAIYKSDANGGNIEKLITNITNPGDIVIDKKQQRIYWSSWFRINDEIGGKVSYARLDGSHQRTIIRHRIGSAGSLAIDSVHKKLYIADSLNNGIYVSGLEGIGVKLIAYSPSPSGIVIDTKNNKVIWSDSLTDKIYSTNLNGKNKKILISFHDEFANPSHIQIDYARQRLVYTINIDYQGIVESSDMNGNKRLIEFSAEKLYNVGGIFIR